MNSRDPVIVGIGRTRYARCSAASDHALGVHAISAALKDAGLSAAQVDGVVRCDREAVWEYDLPGVGAMRNLTFFNAVPLQAGSAPALVRMAAMAIAGGLADVVVGFHARNDAERPVAVPAAVPGWEQFQLPFGVTTRAHEAALLLRRHLRGAADAERVLAMLAVSARRAAVGNQRATQRRALTMTDYRRQPFVAEPLRSADCAGPAAGAGAFVMTTRGRGVASRRPPVGVRATMQHGLPSTDRQLCEWFTTDRNRAVAAAAREMFRQARCRPSDLDLVYLWNGISGMVLPALEHYGFCRRGQSAAFVTGGGVRGLRLNPNGGQLAEAALDGINDLVDAIERIRNGQGRTALVAGSPLDPTSAVLLGGMP